MAVVGQRLELQEELWAQVSNGGQRILVAGAVPAQKGGAGVVGLLRLLLGVLAGARGSFNPGAGGLGSPDLCRVVGLGLERQFLLVTLGI
ncbi:hypothetical protein SRABI128_02339 [Microbacterium sp. Bi128]|nr:hypothetical protein SRABI128_02339 [Microbacterium sp. Bi128]